MNRSRQKDKITEQISLNLKKRIPPLNPNPDSFFGSSNIPDSICSFKNRLDSICDSCNKGALDFVFFCFHDGQSLGAMVCGWSVAQNLSILQSFAKEKFLQLFPMTDQAT